jgi:hypothetical protein
MTGPRDAMAAGIYIVVALVLCAAIGAGLGALFGASVPLAFAGGFIGLGLGFRLVYTRFKDL